MVELPEEYPYGSHRAYLALEPDSIVDVDPVLRLFGSSKAVARERFRDFVAAGTGLEYPEEFDSPVEGDILGSEEFIDSTIHRISQVPNRTRRSKKEGPRFNAEALIKAVEGVFALSRDKFCGPGKTAQAVLAKEVLIMIGREVGASITDLSNITDLDTSNVSRRYDAAKKKANADRMLAYAKELVAREYHARIAESQA
jgi:hypothetical protein